ncbi:hypothetical protein [Cytobacillus citreus]|uniref:hypothetical protein n=1 Tax=Cytobacillus citreus TaxID=2833586 RepID=UPI001BC9CBD3|nr:hypothetical protein [Cytobacillus citreus]
MFNHLKRMWTQSPIKGISFETWGVLFNAMIDGLAIQALLIKDFPVEKVYDGLEQLVKSLTRQPTQEEIK